MPTPADTITIEIDRQTAEQLRTQARARGLTLDAYLRGVAGAGEIHAKTDDAASPGPERMEEVDRWLDDLSHERPPAPSLPVDFSRADVYGDHD